MKKEIEYKIGGKAIEFVDTHKKELPHIKKAELQAMLKEFAIIVVKDFSLGDVTHSTPSYLDNKYEVKWLINNTYQVEQNGNCVYQGSENDCNEWLKCQLGYCG